MGALYYLFVVSLFCSQLIDHSVVAKTFTFDNTTTLCSVSSSPCDIFNTLIWSGANGTSPSQNDALYITSDNPVFIFIGAGNSNFLYINMKSAGGKLHLLNNGVVTIKNLWLAADLLATEGQELIISEYFTFLGSKIEFLDDSVFKVVGVFQTVGYNSFIFFSDKSILSVTSSGSNFFPNINIHDNSIVVFNTTKTQYFAGIGTITRNARVYSVQSSFTLAITGTYKFENYVAINLYLDKNATAEFQSGFSSLGGSSFKANSSLVVYGDSMFNKGDSTDLSSKTSLYYGNSVFHPKYDSRGLITVTSSKLDLGTSLGSGSAMDLVLINTTVHAYHTFYKVKADADSVIIANPSISFSGYLFGLPQTIDIKGSVVVPNNGSLSCRGCAVTIAGCSFGYGYIDLASGNVTCERIDSEILTSITLKNSQLSLPSGYNLAVKNISTEGISAITSSVTVYEYADLGSDYFRTASPLPVFQENLHFVNNSEINIAVDSSFYGLDVAGVVNISNARASLYYLGFIVFVNQPAKVLRAKKIIGRFSSFTTNLLDKNVESQMQLIYSDTDIILVKPADKPKPRLLYLILAVAGGVVLIAGIVLLALYIRRRRRSQYQLINTTTTTTTTYH